jgi:hypothetical protein
MTSPNGASAQAFARQTENSARFLSDEADSLRKLVEREERVHEELLVHVNACADRLRRLRRALAALTDEPAKTRPARNGRDTNGWTISPEKVERVFAAFAQADTPQTPTQLARSVEGLSPESARRAFIVLREQGRIRLVGKTRGGGRTYKVIPTEEVEVNG